MTDPASREQLKDALADVRKAYRLVGEYQRRILELIGFVEDLFPEVGFYYWSPGLWGLPARRASSPVANWAADGLPFYSCSILYLPVDNNDPHSSSWMLEIHHRADTGLFDPRMLPNGRDPVFAGEPDAASGSTELHLVAWRRNESARVKNWFHDGWCELDWPSTEDDIAAALSAGSLKTTGDFARVRKVIDLADLPTREAVRNSVQTFRNELTQLGFVLEQSDPPSP